MLNYVLKPVRHECFYKKYAAKKFLKVCSVCMCWLPLSNDDTRRRASSYVLGRWIDGLRALRSHCWTCCLRSRRKSGTTWPRRRRKRRKMPSLSPKQKLSQRRRRWRRHGLRPVPALTGRKSSTSAARVVNNNCAYTLTEQPGYLPHTNPHRPAHPPSPPPHQLSGLRISCIPPNYCVFLVPACVFSPPWCVLPPFAMICYVITIIITSCTPCTQCL